MNYIILFCSNPTLESFDELPKETQKFFYMSSKVCVKNNHGNYKLATKIIHIAESKTLFRCNKIVGKCGSKSQDMLFNEGDYYTLKKCNEQCSGILMGYMPGISEIIGKMTDLSKIPPVTGKQYIINKTIRLGKVSKKNWTKVGSIEINTRKQWDKITKNGWLAKNLPNVKKLVVRANNDFDFKFLSNTPNHIKTLTIQNYKPVPFSLDNLPTNLEKLYLYSVNANLPKIDNLPVGLKELSIFYNRWEGTDLTYLKNLEKFTFRCKSCILRSQCIPLSYDEKRGYEFKFPVSLINLRLHLSYINGTLELPQNLKTFSLKWCHDNCHDREKPPKIIFPKGIQHARIY